MKRVFTMLVMWVLLCSFSFSQGTDASLSGIVTDPSHAAISNAKVTVRNKSTNLTHTATTDPSGNYSFLTLPIGTYAVTVEQSGFDTASLDLVLETAQKARQDFELRVGQSQQTITVESTTLGLSKEDASLGGVINNDIINDTPLFLRTWDDLLRLVPGVQANRYTEQGGATSSGRTGSFNVHGIHSLQNDFIL